MASLLDALKEGMTKPGSETGGQTEFAQRLLSAKQTGKLAKGTGPSRATEGERIADSVASQEQGAVRQGALSQLEELQTKSDQIAAQAEQTAARQDLQMEDIVQQNQIKTADMLEQIRQQEGQLTAQQRGARLEQAAFNLRMSNEEYLNNLQDEGKKKRLDNQIDFKTELQRTIFADQQSLLEDDLAFKEMMAMKDAEFQKLIANIDINAALQVASDAASAANQTSIWSGVGGLASGAAGYFSEKPDATPKPGGDKP